MITLIEKKDKDKRLLKNWRPILLINVDVKIVFKVMAMRLESTLTFLVHHSQSVYKRKVNIWHDNLEYADILEYEKRKSRTWILVPIDFEKAFDSLNRTFTVKVLQKFNFGIYFSQCIHTFYTNLSSCVLNNGFTTIFFSVSRGIRQGDPLSPLLFILSLEMLAWYIRQDRNIHDLVINNEEMKLTRFCWWCNMLFKR